MTRTGLVEFAPNALALGLLVFLVGWLGPNAASLISGSKNAPAKIQRVAGKVIQKMAPNTTGPIYRSKVRLEYPSSIKVSDTINVRAWLQPEDAYPTTLAGKLESGDFKITATIPSEAASPEFKYEWDWLLSPDKPGSKGVYFWVDPSTELTLDGDAGGASIAPAKNKIHLPIVVTTDLGLTTTQDAWAKAIAGLLALVGTVAGYSFLKRYWEKKKASDE